MAGARQGAEGGQEAPRAQGRIVGLEQMQLLHEGIGGYPDLGVHQTNADSH